MNDFETTTPPPAFTRACEALGLAIPPEALDRLARFLGLLLSANRVTNLTGVRDVEEAWIRHLLDSLSLRPFLGQAHSIVDVGSGGGFPAIPLAIIEPDRTFTLLEATGKKVRFLSETAEALDLPHVRAVQQRAETAGRDRAFRERFDLSMARSVATLPTLLEYLLPLVRVKGRVLAMKGAAAGQEITAARHAVRVLGGGALVLHKTLPGIVEDAVVVETKKIRATPNTYPRLPGVPGKQPLVR